MKREREKERERKRGEREGKIYRKCKEKERDGLYLKEGRDRVY